MRFIARYIKDKKDYFELVTVYETKTQKEKISKEYHIIEFISLKDAYNG